MRVPFSCLALVGSHFAFLSVCADSMFRTVLFGKWKLFYVPSLKGANILSWSMFFYAMLVSGEFQAAGAVVIAREFHLRF